MNLYEAYRIKPNALATPLKELWDKWGNVPLKRTRLDGVYVYFEDTCCAEIDRVLNMGWHKENFEPMSERAFPDELFEI